MTPEMINPPRPSGPFSAVIFTSETGVLAAQMDDLPKRAFCVGQRTADAAAMAGFSPQFTQGDWRPLYDLILAEKIGGRLLFLHAQEAAPDLANALNSAGIETVSIPVYRQKAQGLTAPARDLLCQSAPVVIPFFSARSAQIFCQEYIRTKASAPLYIAALSDQVARAVTLRAAHLQMAQRPTAQDMAEAVVTLAALC
jgi:uroporphyrinogen-III synthase